MVSQSLVETGFLRAEVPDQSHRAASSSTGGPGITFTFLESISTGSDFASASDLHLPFMKLLKPEEAPDISGTAGF
tara:strand:- start:32364 stop:32591 length:228 start_codon:yes stop_codon:yes gene_type:complete